MTVRQDSTRKARIGRLMVAGSALSALSIPALAITPAGAKAKPMVVSVVKTPAGTVLVSKGRTLYTLQPSASACTAACLKVWPAVVLPAGTQKAAAGKGVTQSTLGVKTTSNGRQVTYKGSALYWYTGDTATGQVNGNLTDKWGRWSAALTKSGGTTTPTSGASNSGSGGTSF